MRKGVTTHSTLDNNDERQQTLTGAGTTHDTNKILFHLPTREQREETPKIGSQVERPLDIWNSVKNEYQTDDEQQESQTEVDVTSEADGAVFSSSTESDSEVSDFLSSEDSGNEWIP
eukprot:gene17177-18906_t